MWDNGAFSAFTKGSLLQPKKFYDWVEPRLGHPHWAVIPDVIDGSVEQQREYVNEWPFEAEYSCPVWHLALPTDYLLELTDRFPKVCFGSSGAFWNVGSPSWEKRCDEAFNALARHRIRMPWIHMLRGLAQAGKRWPFASADSVNVARNFKNGNGRDCEKMAREIDSIQTPISWTHVNKNQMNLLEI